MITEDYISFEVAKLLKEKGFDEIKCNTCYKWNGNFCNNRRSMSGIDNEICYQAPTLQMAMKWLRETHNLFVFPFPQMNTNKFWVEIYQLSNSQEWENLYCESIDLQDYPLYEQACEFGIRYCLEKLI